MEGHLCLFSLLKKFLLFSIIPIFHQPGLIELPEPIKFTASIRPAKLSIDCNDLDEGETVIAVGNGMTDENPQNSAHDTILRHGLSEVLPTIECARILYNLNNRDWVICTGSQAGQFALCGDSGKCSIENREVSLVNRHKTLTFTLTS